MVARAPARAGVAARTVTAGRRRVSVTDGPYTESVEQLSGFYLVGTSDLDDLRRVRRDPRRHGVGLECCASASAGRDGTFSSSPRRTPTSGCAPTRRSGSSLIAAHATFDAPFASAASSWPERRSRTPRGAPLRTVDRRRVSTAGPVRRSGRAARRGLPRRRRQSRRRRGAGPDPARPLTRSRCAPSSGSRLRSTGSDG